MLKALTVKNYAIIDDLAITFDQGFSVITGETGAGKSILVGALTLILGKRAETGILKDKTKKSIIEGEFDISGMDLHDFFAQNDLDEDTSAFLRREILPSGKSRAFINDTPVNLNTLKELGTKLVDIHSQHQTLMLGDTLFQLETLDSFLLINGLKQEYLKLYNQYTALKKQRDRLVEQETESKRDEDYLRFQLEEFDRVNLDTDAFTELEERLNFLTHAGEVAEVLNEVSAELSINDWNILDKLAYLKEKFYSIESFFPKAKEFGDRLESVWLELKDMAEESERLKADTDFNPLELENLEEETGKIYKLQQKHRVNTLEELQQIKGDLEQKLHNISSMEEQIAELTKELNKLEKALTAKAAELSKIRNAKKELFAQSVKNTLQKLGMKDAVFTVKIDPLPDFTPAGKDKVTFLFNANKGMAPDEIAKIASGGELSRLMLALKSLITENSLLPTVIFDEIDTGVSGDIAGKVGNIMKSMAQHHQLIVITHLPQIAAKADVHYKVFKETVSGTTRTNIVRLDKNNRITEIAAMMSDDKITDAARKAAKELMN